MFAYVWRKGSNKIHRDVSVQLKQLYIDYTSALAGLLGTLMNRSPLKGKSALSGADAPLQQLKILRRFIPKRLQPILRGVRKRLQRPSSLEEPYYSVYPYTQAAMIRQQNLMHLSQDIEAKDLTGAIVECGVLDGGTAALMAYASRTSRRQLHLFDSWEGLPDSGSKDGEGGKMWVGECVGSPHRVLSIMKRLGVDPSRLTFHKGWFDQTFAIANVQQIALLHIDADFYESVRLCLDTWYPRLSPGGYIQFDDYGIFIGCTRAVDEFLVQHPEVQLRSVGEGTLAYFIQKPA
jgi:O-methyltransferase